MSTRLSKEQEDSVSVPTGYEGYNIPEDEFIPSCTIEDVDRAIFNLFNKDLPMVFEYKNESKRIPVIFATGERFAVLRRKRPLRDKHGALILPLVSIMRSGIAQDVDKGMGPGQTAPMIVKKKLSPKDPAYQAWINKLGLVNQDNLASPEHFISEEQGAKAGTVASRRAPTSAPSRDGRLLDPQLGKNVFEIITLPPTKFFNSTYEVTLWAQYTQQMNGMMMAIMSSYQNNHRRTFRVETDKGYWFVAYVDSEFSSGSNYDDFTDEERIVRCTFTVSIPAYVIASDHPGGMNPLRKFISAPTIEFGVTEIAGQIFEPLSGGPPSGDPSSYILQDLATCATPTPGDSIGSSAVASTLNAAGYDIPGGSVASSDSRAINNNSDGGSATSEKQTSTLGGSSSRSETTLYKVVIDPFTGKSVRKVVRVKSRNQRKGETVYRGGITIDLGRL
jgi:hypothetical protein